MTLMGKTSGAVVRGCGCAPWGMCAVAKKLDERIALEKAGVRVLTDATLKASGMAFAQSEVRLRRQVELVAKLTEEYAAHEVL